MEPITTPETLFSRDVLGRYVCNTWDESVANPEGIDVVILGSGLYGGYAAAKFYELSKARGLGDRGLRVLILDAGPFLLPGHAENIPSLKLFAPDRRACGSGSDPAPNNEVWGIGWRSAEPFVGSAYCVGGKGLFWGGWCPRLLAEDLVFWPQEVRDFFTLEQSTLPKRPLDHTENISNVTFKKDDPLSGYEALEYEIGVTPSDDFIFDPTDAQNPNLSSVGLNESLFGLCATIKNSTNIGGFVDVAVAPIAVQTQSYISGLFSLDKYSSVPALIAAAREDHSSTPPNRIAIVPNTHVVALESAPSAEAGGRGTRVIQTIVVRNAGKERRLRIAPHCQVVLALGCIESTRLALESFSRIGSGLAPQGELMGRNYMIHYREDFRFSVSRANLAAWAARNFPGRSLHSWLQQAALHLQFNTPHGRLHYQLYAAQGSSAEPAMYRMIPDLEAQQLIRENADPRKITLILRGIAEQLGDAPQINQDPGGTLGQYNPDFGFIDLAGANDVDNLFDHRRAWVQFPATAEQAPIWGEMFNKATDIFQEIKSALADASNNFEALGHQGLGTTYHDSGTLWMGDNPDTSVTDANGHFHHVTNAYCIDQSIFPTVGSANPVLTGLVLARKTVEDILSKHRSHVPSPFPLGLASVSLTINNGWATHPYNGMNEVFPGIIETQPFPPPGQNAIGLYYLPILRTDWEVIVEWKAFREGDLIPNAGILFRLPDPKPIDFNNDSALKAYFAQAIEVQIDESGKNFRGADTPQNEPKAIFGDSRFKTGAVYGVAPARQWAAKFLSPTNTDAYWNEFRISVLGDKVKVHLNDKLVCDATVPPALVHPGFFGLQFHTGKVQFRNLQVN